LTCPHNHTHLYTRKDIFAEETETNVGLGGALAGGIIGLLARGVDAVIGVLTGGMLGGNRERQDKESVSRFNNSTRLMVILLLLYFL
jgi:phage tail tape-measure protein